MRLAATVIAVLAAAGVAQASPMPVVGQNGVIDVQSCGSGCAQSVSVKPLGVPKKILRLYPDARTVSLTPSQLALHKVAGGWATKDGPQTPPSAPVAAAPMGGICIAFAPPCTYCWGYRFQITQTNLLGNSYDYHTDRGICQWQGSSTIGNIWTNTMDSDVWSYGTFKWQRSGSPYVISAYGGVGSSVWDKNSAQNFDYCVFYGWYSCSATGRGHLDVWMGGNSPSNIFVFTAAID